MCAQWTVDKAGNRLADVTKAAELSEPLFICKAGSKEAVLISPETWENIVTPKKPSFQEALFSIPQGEPFIDENGRKELELRDVEF